MWHKHRFDERDGVTVRTVMTDTVECASPLGPVGRVADRLFPTGYVTRLLEQRKDWLVRELSGAEGWAS